MGGAGGGAAAGPAPPGGDSRFTLRPASAPDGAETPAAEEARARQCVLAGRAATWRPRAGTVAALTPPSGWTLVYTERGPRTGLPASRFISLSKTQEAGSILICIRRKGKLRLAETTTPPSHWPLVLKPHVCDKHGRTQGLPPASRSPGEGSSRAWLAGQRGMASHGRSGAPG